MSPEHKAAVSTAVKNFHQDKESETYKRWRSAPRRAEAMREVVQAYQGTNKRKRALKAWKSPEATLKRLVAYYKQLEMVAIADNNLANEMRWKAKAAEVQVKLDGLTAPCSPAKCATCPLAKFCPRAKMN